MRMLGGVDRDNLLFIHMSDAAGRVAEGTWLPAQSEDGEE